MDEVKPATLPVNTLMARVQATLPDTVQCTGITILPDPERTWQVGSWLGDFTRLINFLAALLGATLPLTGYYLWLRRLKNRRKRPTRE